MKKIYFLFCIFLLTILFNPGRSEAQLLSGYNQQFYTSVFDAAEGIAMPFLLQQGFMTMSGVQIYNDTMLLYNGQVYPIMSNYRNPEPTNGYYLTLSQYPEYQIQIFTNVWHINIPNVFYNSSNYTFSSLVDCVGYGTRLLSATGDTTEAGNAYLRLISMIKSANRTRMAERGFVASAYEFGAAFPTLPDSSASGWMYVAGNILADSINAYNHRVDPALLQYNGQVKGGYNLAMPGDILSFAYSPDSELGFDKLSGGGSNGHFMVLAQSPYLINFDTIQHFYPHVQDTAIQSFLNTYNVYATSVYDCSGIRAHFHDSRVYMSGIGHGTLWILTQPSTGTPEGFIFEPPFDTVTSIRPYLLDPEHTWAISVGRYTGTTGIGGTGTNQIPASHSLEQNYPNPFNPATYLKFHIKEKGFVRIMVYDAAGREVETLVNETLNAGTYETNWDAASLPSGVYFCQLKVRDYIQTRKMVLSK
jgi:hypothetical protein